MPSLPPRILCEHLMRWKDIAVVWPTSVWDGGLLPESIEAGQIVVRVLPHVRQTVRDHLGQCTKEQGGLLLGRLHHASTGSKSEVIVVSVEEVVPALEGIGTEVSLNMPASLWSHARRKQTAEQVILGWYHSHPNIGAFFSATDRETQSAFFNQAWSLGWVIDPIRREQAWFLGPNSEPIAPQLLKFQ